MFTQSENRGKGIFLIAVVAVFAMAVFFGCNQPPAPVQTAKPAEPVQQPAAAPQPAGLFGILSGLPQMDHLRKTGQKQSGLPGPCR